MEIYRYLDTGSSYVLIRRFTKGKDIYAIMFWIRNNGKQGKVFEYRWKDSEWTKIY